MKKLLHLLFISVFAFSLTASVAETELFTRQFPASADAFIFQDEPDANFGAGTTTWIKSYGAYHRELFIRFELPVAAVQNYQIETAHIRLFRYGMGSGDAVIPFTVCSLDDNDWSEKDITWNNPPEGITLPSINNPRTDAILAQNVTIPLPETSYTDIDVTEHVRATHIAGHSSLSIHIYTTTTDNLDQRFFSREAQTKACHPKLHVTLTDRPTGLTGAWLDNSTVTLTWAPYTLEADTYFIQRAPTADGPFSTIATTVETTHTDTTTTLDSGNTYYRVIATRNADNFTSPPSAVITPTHPLQTSIASASGFIKNNNGADTTFSNSDKLEVRRGPIGDYREAFIRFDTSNLYFVETADLDLHYHSKLDSGNIVFTISSMAETTPPWSEPNLTWNWMENTAEIPLPTETQNPATELALFNTANLDPSSHLIIDIAATLANLANHGEPLNLHLLSLTPGGSGNHMAYISSTRAADPSTRPAIHYTLAPIPRHLRATPANNAITLQWEPLGTGIGGILQRSLFNSDNWQTIAAIDANTTSYSDLNVTSGSTYSYRLAKSTPDAYTGTFSEVVSAFPITTTTLIPLDDTFVVSGTPGAALGNNTQLLIKTTTNIVAQREVFIRFDIPRRHPINSAHLTLTADSQDSDTSNTILVVESMIDFTEWNESSLTWNNGINAGLTLPSIDAPAPQGTFITRRQAAHLQSDDTITLDVTTAAETARVSKRPLILHLYSETPGNNNMLYFASKEHTTRPGPTLVLTHPTSPPGTCLMIK